MSKGSLRFMPSGTLDRTHESVKSETRTLEAAGMDDEWRQVLSA
jgi:hypothetical protein